MRRPVFHILLWLFVAWCLAPFVWQIVTSLKSNEEIGAIPNVYVPQRVSGEHGYLRATVDGRADDVLRYAGVDVHPVVLRHVFVTSPNVVDYQVHQTPRGVDVAALGTCGLDVAGLRHRLTCALEKAGLADPQVTVRPVDSLDRHHQTGKLRRFVPLPST